MVFGFITVSMRRLLLIFLLLTFFSRANGKGKDTVGWYNLFVKEQALLDTAMRVVDGSNDTIRSESAWYLHKQLQELLQDPVAVHYSFDSLRTRTVSIVQAPDNSFRIFTFNLILNDGRFQNFGFLEWRKKKETEIFSLIDTAKKHPKDVIDAELGPEEWYGSLYYSVNAFKQKGKKLYLLLGFDGADIHSNKKVMDVLWFDKYGPHFGYPAFRDGWGDPSAEYRVIYEFHNQSIMLLRHEPERNIIVLDNLAAAFPEATGDFRYYIPTGDYDMYELTKKGTWIKGRLQDHDLGQDKKLFRPVERPVPTDEEPSIDKQPEETPEPEKP